jgi:acyl carrier protein
MTLAATIALVRAEIERLHDCEPSEIDETTTWHELDCDPIDVLTIAHACEDAFEIRLPIEIEDCMSVGELAAMIAELRKGRVK